MVFPWFRPKIRHPFFPGLAADLAAAGHGRSAALAGTFAELAHAAECGAAARRAVYVLIKEGEPLTAGERDELWHLFEVPVYALVQRYGRVEAWECETQNGLHGEGGGGAVTCACGRPGALTVPSHAASHAAD